MYEELYAVMSDFLDGSSVILKSINRSSENLSMDSYWRVNTGTTFEFSFTVYDDRQLADLMIRYKEMVKVHDEYERIKKIHRKNPDVQDAYDEYLVIRKLVTGE